MQTLITAIVVACAVAYAAWRVYDTMSHAGSQCRGCKLAEVCKKKRNGCDNAQK